LKEEIGNKNIQCEKILLEKIKSNLKEKNKDNNNHENIEQDQQINKKINPDNKENDIKDFMNNKENNIHVEDYLLTIEKFVEGEINHLNKFKTFINILKEKGQQNGKNKELVIDNSYKNSNLSFEDNQDNIKNIMSKKLIKLTFIKSINKIRE